MPKVWNKRETNIPAGAVYIGRLRGGIPGWFGNPYRIGMDGDRVAVIEKFRAYVLARPDHLTKIRSELRGKDLVCWCAPEPCHGDVLLEIANAE